MAPTDISSKQKWDQAHLDLNSSLENEIHLMREILASLHQEELTLLEQDYSGWGRVMELRSDLIMLIRDERAKRMDRTAELTRLAVELQKAEILPAEEESSCDILTKLDQVIALSERTNLQNSRNDALFDQSKQKQDLPLECPFPHPVHMRSSRKTSIALDTEKDVK